jgi:hypothetical protein
VPLDQLLRALPVILPLGVLPGLALAILIAPRTTWPERLAAAPGLSVGAVGIAGLTLHAAHVSFSSLPVVAILFGIVCAAALRAWRSPDRPHGRDSMGWEASVLALVPGVVLVGLVVGFLHADPLPPGDDPATHAAVAAAIVRQADVIPIVPVPIADSGYVRNHSAFEITDALASELGAGNAASAMLPLTVPSLLLLPLGVALIAYEAFGDRRVAAAASLLSLGLVFPVAPISYGDYPYVVDSTLIAPLVLAVARTMRGTDVGASAALAGILILSMWTIHGLEILTAAVIGIPLWLMLLFELRGSAIRGIVAAAVATLAGATAGDLLTRSPIVPPQVLVGSGPLTDIAALFSPHSGVSIASVVNAFETWDLSVVVGSLLVAGVIAAIVRHRGRWLLVALVIPVLAAYDVVGPEWLHSFWIRIYPWNMTDRLAGIEFFILPALGGAGAVALLDLLAHLLARRSAGAMRTVSQPVAVGLVGAVALSGLVLGVSRAAHYLSVELPTYPHASNEDVAVIHTLASHLRPGSVVLNNGVVDAGQWFDALTSDVDAVPESYVQEYPDNWKVVALANACSKPARAEAALDGVQAIFVGSRPDRAYGQPWSATCVASIPGVHLVAGGTSGAAGFLVGS